MRASAARSRRSTWSMHPVAHAPHVGRRRLLERVHAGLRQHGEHHPPIGRPTVGRSTRPPARVRRGDASRRSATAAGAPRGHTSASRGPAPRTGTRAPGSRPSSGRARRGRPPARPSDRRPSRRRPPCRHLLVVEPGHGGRCRAHVAQHIHAARNSCDGQHLPIWLWSQAILKGPPPMAQHRHPRRHLADRPRRTAGSTSRFAT